MAHQSPRIQCATAGHRPDGPWRIRWSDDDGQTWHEPEDAPLAITAEWQRRQQTASKEETLCLSIWSRLLNRAAIASRRRSAGSATQVMLPLSPSCSGR
jgi:hypothetical protein